MPLHCSLGDKSETPSQKQKQKDIVVTSDKSENRRALTLLPSLECGGTNLTHCSLDVLDSSDSPKQPGKQAGATTPGSSFFSGETGSSCAAQAGPGLK